MTMKDLDEYTRAELLAEIDRRELCDIAGVCDYCNQTTLAKPCKFPERHAQPYAEKTRAKACKPISLVGNLPADQFSELKELLTQVRDLVSPRPAVEWVHVAKVPSQVQAELSGELGGEGIQFQLTPADADALEVLVYVPKENVTQAAAIVETTLFKWKTRNQNTAQ